MQFEVMFNNASRHLLNIASATFGAAIAQIAIEATPAIADGAYVVQASGASGEQAQRAKLPMTPLAVLPATQRSHNGTSFVPTPENSSARSLNATQTLEIGRNNQVAQFQSGHNNSSDVGILGGSGNAVGVVQCGNDLSNLYLVNTRGLSVGVLQPNGAGASNVLIARLPNGALLIKK